MKMYEFKVFDEEEIRDTSIHWSNLADNRGYALKTIIIENSHNSTATLECWASAHEDFSKPFKVGSSWEVGASTNSYQTCESYFPFMKIKLTFDVAPTSGNIDVHFIELMSK